MTTQLLPKDRSLSKLVANSPVLDQICKNILLKNFAQLKKGSLNIYDGKDHFVFGDQGEGIHASLSVHRSSFYSRTLLGGSIGNAESYVDGDWDSSTLTDLVRLFVVNRDLLQGIDGGWGALFRPLQKITHGLRRNTIEGSRKNIRSHYDIGNEFFKLFLDETMMYSSALFDSLSRSLQEASVNKIERICGSLRLGPSDHLLEIGTGWGSLAIHAALKYGCQVTTTTISREQYDYAQAKVRALGLEGKVHVLFEDYRHLTGVYDKLVSVEMIEAVGLEHLDTYFQKCSSLLKSDGIFVLQAITIRDHFYESAKNSVDFIQRHIFPGCGIPCISAMMDSVKRKTDLVLTEQKDFAEDYAETLKRWAQNLRAHQSDITDLGYPDFLHRLWQYYFSYCEGGFRERALGLSQMTLTKPQFKERSFL